MSWSKTKVNGRNVFSETVALGNAGDTYSSAIGFIPRGVGFTGFINTGALNTVGAVTTDLQGSFDGTNWVTIDASFAADCDTAMVSKVYVAATSGDFPYYRFKLSAAANDSANSIVVKVIPTE